MASPSKFIKKRIPVRSISFPGRSHPSTVRIEEELKKFKTWELPSDLTAESICNGLSRLEELYRCLNDVLNLPMTKQATFQHQQERCVDELLDESMMLLDICGAIRDIISQIKEHVRDVQSALRRRKGDLSLENSIAQYALFRKNINKDTRRLIAALRRVDSKMGFSLLPGQDHHHHFSSIVRVIRDVSERNILAFQSILMFLSVPLSKPKPSKWLLVSKVFVNKGVIAFKEQVERVDEVSSTDAAMRSPSGFGPSEAKTNANEVESADAALSSLCRVGSSEGKTTQIAKNRLVVLESCIESIDKGLESMFRHLIRTRASLLNIISH